MKMTSSYIHALEGRLRIKASQVKGAPARALEVENSLRTLGCLQEESAATTGTSASDGMRLSLGEALAESLVRSTMELALQGLIRALI